MLTNIAVVAAVVIAAFLLYSSRNAGTVAGTEAKELVAAGATLVDVRSPSEFSSGHIEGAVNIPVDRVAGRLGELGDKTKAVVVYCRSGARSARAKSILEGKGFTSVSNLGGMHRWP